MKNNYRTQDGVAIIEINSPKYGRFETSVNIDDLHTLLELNCSIYVINRGVYMYANIYLADEKRSTRLHRYLLGEPSDLVIDHINHNTLCNERINLRAVTQVENTQNMGRVRSDNKSGFRGVIKKGKRWEAYVYANGKRHYLGSYTSPEEAGQVAANYRAVMQSSSPDAREIENPVLPEIKHDKGRENKSSGIKGITWYKKYQKWHPQINSKGKLHHGGFYDNLEDAKIGLEELRQRVFNS